MRSLFLSLVLVMPVWAAEDPPQPEPFASTDGDISEAEWRDMAMGKTLTYYKDGKFFALERYAPTGNQVALQFYHGECITGTWSHMDNQYCFMWQPNRNVCFRHVKAGDNILIIPTVDGADAPGLQHMVDISDAPLDCGQNLS